jgi:TrmH family RNA methyltransferase
MPKGYGMQEKSNSRALGSIETQKTIEIVVVLVSPRDARNIGSVARAMSNLGVLDLRLVNPSDFEVELAEKVACWGKAVVQQHKVYSSLSNAISDCTEVVGFASDSGKHRVAQMTLDQWIESLSSATEQRIAVVFGCEENGLQSEHFPLCQYLVRIPSVAENPSYNLAQSVLLALYSLQTKYSAIVGNTAGPMPQSKELENLTDMVLKVAEEVGFLHEHSPPHIKDIIVNLSRRGRMTGKELKMITGLCGMVFKKLQIP